ncbi:E3 ubiquitin-protein ligase BOI isoform X1 [Ziziphus jujuba]|uniref:E3 ubiquitin-protein ligase BOI isoform X1 n=1 Tax=Ziziphus jujuba TaxID=326968 RepID=A0ABM3I7T9_ZIZJJ|nr:E3 ubiquitin-protein ligase BOI isoform X1 [Ziziphus jujuba var. spinosa]XP_015894744.2 E3 ubiquitin-protein ligase BOI isoform X1 [Ziziphus jujuba var. spinosa]XP_048322465.1 E3 ubiquitin-protein ligase BOI isoform X1 [Ziziphus jujuba]XP_048322466.1 E3 ubiquitin-protein ligase BOI isoform X1 [Ziziphus jujuba]XP_060669283.1 E3 ubiquitin-protein ligase BOI isoform X1 [Ziziphus jujuba]
MLGGNNGNPVLPMFLEENRFPYPTNASNQLQLFGNVYDAVPAGCNVDPVNYFGNEHITPILRPNKRSREMEDISRQQKLQISLNYNVCQDEADRSASIPNPNPVSTGLRLSYDDDERNSSVTSASGSMTAAPSIIYSLGDNIRTELDRQKEEFDQYMKIQEEHLAKGVRDMKQRHIASFLAAIEKGVSKKLRDKDIELENMSRKNRELVERIKQMAMEAQNWHYRAKYNESVVNVLKTNLQQAISQGADQGKEGFGDSEVDDAASYIDPNNLLSIPGGALKSFPKNYAGSKEHNMNCRACKKREVSILLMPCRHLCLCKECEGLTSVCPVCQLMKTASVQVYLS